MAVTSCRECGKDVSESAKKCPHCGVKNPARSAHYMAMASTAIGVGLVAYLLLSGAGANFVDNVLGATSRACEVTSVRIAEDMFIINGQPDYGLVVTASVTKTSRSGSVTVFAELSTSEGSLTKQRSISLADQQSQDVQLQFPEPTINATQITARGWCST